LQVLSGHAVISRKYEWQCAWALSSWSFIRLTFICCKPWLASMRNQFCGIPLTVDEHLQSARRKTSRKGEEGLFSYRSSANMSTEKTRNPAFGGVFFFLLPP
jgi:hypothetical protein